MDLAKQLRNLRIYVAVLTVIVLACIITIVFLGRGNTTRQFEQLTAQRINIVEPDGRLDLVISNAVLQHPGRFNGKDLKPRPRPAGLIYFNEEGDECGGYVWYGTKKENGMSLTADQYKNDQIMALDYTQDSGAVPSRTYGFKLWDRSDSFTLPKAMAYYDSVQDLKDTAERRKGLEALRKANKMSGNGTERLFLGRTRDGYTGLFIRDDQGIPRMRICISKDNKPLIQMLGDDGQPVSTWDGKK